jgi:hypothetical protein
MRFRVALVLALAVLAVVSPGFAQQRGVIDGKVTDASGGVVPGITVVLTGDVLLQPLTAVTGATGTFRFPGLSVGIYSLKFELSGFKTVVRSGLRMESNANLTINALMEVSTVQETVTVTGETPVVDLRDTSKTARLTQETLQSIPSARDPWVMIEQTPSVMMDRSNVGGSMSGQQSNFNARGAGFAQQKWNLDGVDITDMSATGGSPVYYDFDAFEEMQISTGGADVTMMTPGVGINLVTKSGSDKFRGSARYYWTGERFESINVTDALRTQGASSGAPIQDIKDYGAEIGGPIKRGRAWFWGAYGMQNVKVGVNGFYKPDASCQAVKAAPLTYGIKDVWDCLNTDLTELKNYNAKFAVAPFKGNQFSFFFNAAGKIRNARGADDLHPIESTTPQGGVKSDIGLGSKWWKTGIPKTYKWGDRHVFSDRFMVEAQYAHVGNNFTLDFHDPALRTVQPSYERFAPAALWGRSLTGTVYVRPTDSIDLTGNYFLPGFLGGDHAIKFGGKIRNDVAHSESGYGGNAVDRFAYGNPSYVTIYRDSYSEYQLRNRNLYLQDTYTRKRLTINFGIRWDYQTDESRPGTVDATAFFGQATFNGTMTYCSSWSGGNCTATRVYTTTGQPFNQLPAVNFAGAKAFGDATGAYKNFSPRIGLTYDLSGTGKSVAKFSYARYVSQAGTGDLSSTYTTTGSNSYVEYPWIDLNNDKFVSANEIVMIPVPLGYGGGYDYANPAALAKPTGKNDPNIKMEHTDEVIVSLDQAFGQDFAVGASFIYRKAVDFRGSYNTDSTFTKGDWSTKNYTGPYTFTPAATACPSGASCNAVQYWTPNEALGYFIYSNNPSYYRAYKGFELTARKRMSHRWMANASYSWNSNPQYYPTGSYQNPTNIEPQNGGQYAPQSTTSGIDNVFVNAKWLARFSSSYQLPWWQLGVAGFLNLRSGFPFLTYIQTGSYTYTGTTTIASSGTSVYLNKVGDNRLPSVPQLDLRLDKAVKIGRLRATASVDLFNAFNGNTVLAKRRQQNATNANYVSAILAPRVLRFGIRATF